MFRLLQKADKAIIIKKIEKKVEELLVFEQYNRHLYKYFVTGLLISGGLIVNNYESVCSIFFLTNTRLKKRIDSLFGNQKLDANVKIEMSDEPLISIKKGSEIIEKDSYSIKDQTDPKLEMQALNDSESQIIKDIGLNKQHLKLSILELENKKNETIALKNSQIEKLKSEFENQNLILNEIYLKNNLNENEIKQIDQLKLQNENNLTLKITNGIINGNDKESETIISYLAKYNSNLVSSNEAIAKLSDTFTEFTKSINSISEEIVSKDNIINTLKDIEEKYLVSKQLLFDSEQSKSKENTSKDIKTNSTESNHINIPINLKIILENDKKIISTIEELFTNLKQTNNFNNVLSYNKSISHFTSKLSNLSDVAHDEFTKKLLILNVKRYYSNVELFNEFQHIKRDLLFSIVFSKLTQYFNKDLIIPTVTAALVSKSTGFILSVLSPADVYLIIDGNETSFMKKFKALYHLNKHIKSGNNIEAYKDLNYLKEENEKGILNRLTYKLGVNTREEYSINLLKNHFI